MRFLACLVAAAALAASLATTARASNTTVRVTFRTGVADVRNYKRASLERRLVETLVALRRDRASSPEGRRGRSLAIEGFTHVLRGVRAEIEFYEEDSGRLAEATIDATRADRQWKRGAQVLRAAGRALGVPVGTLNGR